MKETVALEDPRTSLAVDPSVREGLADTRARLAARSLIVWGEHCTECAAPACYSSCDLYTPRLDGHCRRFARGIERVEAQGVAPGALHRIVFRRIGKLEGRGPVGPAALDVADARERAAAPPPHPLVPPVFARRAAWRRTEADRAASAGDPRGFDAFVIEGLCANRDEQAFTLTFTPADKTAPGLFQTRFTLGRAWTRHAIDLADIARGLDLSAAHLIQIEPVGDAEGIEVVLGFVDFATWAEGRAPAAPPATTAAAAQAAQVMQPAAKAKVVVWDLDHTVWDGILLEDGPEGVRLRPGVRDAMEALDARGILQSVASKNEPALAAAGLAAHGLSDLILAPQVGWGAKSASIRRLAEVLNLGLDSFVFIDDQPFERGEVGESLPMVRVLPETAVEGLIDRPEFDVPITPESRGRRALYRVEALRAEAADASGGDLDAFLRGCRLELRVAPLTQADAERVHELSQRTNQLNLAATRYTREDVAAMVAGVDGEEAWTLRCDDRFGDYGLIGFARVAPADGRIVDFFMSCRVQRKRVEAAFFAWLAERMRAAGAGGMHARWVKAQRNAPALALFQDLGFAFTPRPTEDGPETGDLFRATDLAFPGADVVTVSPAALSPPPPVASDLG